MNFVLDTLLAKVSQSGKAPYDRIDTGKIGVFGHSLGGATAVAAGRERSDISAVIDIEGTMLAEYTGLSESYLSRVFKQNLGISISDYIREKKIEKATHLLRYSDKSIIDIANYLSFSSQSHFIQTFENFTGMTPKKYRNKYYKSMW